MQQHGSKYLARRPPPPPTVGVWSICKNSTFSKHGHIAYQNKWNHECINMSQIFYPQTTPNHDTWVQKVKIQLFQNRVMLHIILKGIMVAATW